MPNTSTPSINSEVAIGRRMKGSEIFIAIASLFRSTIVERGRARRYAFSSPHPGAPAVS